ncbi:uncharacterized protein A1O9_05144 [Exophiala aquamarina CBS 119918]|uniref:Cardiolipin synthase N-terminal domain-containing protein n=1 Tax=Exophiala aquamarina CBS 119918 TaxID=1182545 RepID=A0A072PLV9_9EURO|nr:uncharacterized protein A1O9_05144 [Exophiala aquamarina CBS 119918]KEF60293.1 hypothetical protein A1O9_05144 [Exophiala aquamarina CBS 119918]
MSQNTLFLMLQLALASLATAAPVKAQSNSWQYGTGGGIIGLIVFILDIIVFVEVVQSTRPVSHKLLWSLLVFLFPIGGIIIYALFSNRAAHKPSGGYEPISS